MKQYSNENLILEKTISFSLDIIEYCEILESKKKYNMANQLFRSGTSIGANVHEAQNPESLVDFIHKLKIAAKEVDETKYWLILCENSKSYPFKLSLKKDLQEIALIVYKIISTSKRKLKNSKKFK